MDLTTERLTFALRNLKMAAVASAAGDIDADRRRALRRAFLAAGLSALEPDPADAEPAPAPGAAEIEALTPAAQLDSLDDLTGALIRESAPEDRRRLANTVLRPLFEAAMAGRTPEVDLSTLAGAAATGAIRAAVLRAATTTQHPALLEAAAGLMRSDRPGPAQTPAGPPRVMVSTDGPYLALDVPALKDHLGVDIPPRSIMALCRCGRSATKPFCDGAHALSDFTGEKSPQRQPDRLDLYRGQQATVFDNRGLCAHSGFCTDRLASVFHVGEEPFVTPSGGRLDEIVNAVRNCPSGALGLGFEAQEDRSVIDTDRPPAIEVSQDGPYRLTGGVAVLGPDAEPVARPQGASPEHCSLCRCGSSLNKPFCSGMHWSVDFHDPVPDPEHEPTLFEWAGGYPALLRMTRIFYAKHVPADPEIGPLFASMSPDHPERVATWLSEVFGGPGWYTQRYGGYERMIGEHLNKKIRPEQRARWAALMALSADEAGLPQDAEFRAAFAAYIEWGSRIAVENSQEGVTPPPRMPVPRWWWVCNATPEARIRAAAVGAAPSIPSAPSLPDPAEAVSFDRHVKPLFRDSDRRSMRFGFDLWAAADVKTHGPAILARLKAGTMPCDGAWPADRVAVFQRWLAEGCAP